MKETLDEKKKLTRQFGYIITNYCMRTCQSKTQVAKMLGVSFYTLSNYTREVRYINKDKLRAMISNLDKLIDSGVR